MIELFNNVFKAFFFLKFREVHFGSFWKQKLLVRNMWNVYTRPTSASDFFYRKTDNGFVLRAPKCTQPGNFIKIDALLELRFAKIYQFLRFIHLKHHATGKTAIRLFYGEIWNLDFLIYQYFPISLFPLSGITLKIFFGTQNIHLP
jgi:hypothetical protein